MGARMSERPVIGRVADETSLAKAIIKLNRSSDVRPLELLITEAEGGIRILLRVVEVRSINPYLNPKSLDVEEKTGVSASPFEWTSASLMPGVYRLAEVEVVDCYREEDGHIRPIGRVRAPSPGAPVYRADHSVVRAILGRTTCPLLIGYLAGTDGVPFELDANIFMRHALIIGNPGTGKSFLLGVLLEELQRYRARVVNFDPLDEYSLTVEDLGGVNLIVGRDYMPRLDVLSEGEFAALIEAHVPTDFQRAIAREGFRSWKQASLSAERMTRRPLEPDRLLHHVEEAAERMRASDETRMNTLERLRFLLESLRIVGTGGRDLSTLIENNRLVNITFRGADETQITFSVASILREILSLRTAERVGNLLVSADEAHLLVPSGRSNPPSRGVIKRIMRYGRHFGIGVVLLTQLPASLDQEVVSLPSLRIIFATSPEQVRGISHILADLPKNVLQDLPRLERGTAIVTGARDLVRHSVYVRIRSDRKSRHGAPTPPLVETRLQEFMPR